MRTKLVMMVMACWLSGCAGLNVEWQMQASYLSEELAAKRKTDAQEAVDRAHDTERAAATIRALSQ